MATYRRALTPGATYFFTVNTYRRQTMLTERPFYEALKQSLRQVKTMHPFTIDVFVFLPDHLHCLRSLPKGDAEDALRWNCIKRPVSQQTRERLAAPLTRSRQKRRELGLWQRRFWEHQIGDERDFAKQVDYVHWNPVKHGYVKCVNDWPYSSFRRYVARGVYAVDWAYAAEDEGEDFWGMRLVRAECTLRLLVKKGRELRQREKRKRRIG